MSNNRIYLGLDLSETTARAGIPATGIPERPFDSARLSELIRIAQRGVLDFVALDEHFSVKLSSNSNANSLDAALVSSRIGPRTEGIGLLSAIDHTKVKLEHIVTAQATVDRVSNSRAALTLGGLEADQIVSTVTAAREEATRTQGHSGVPIAVRVADLPAARAAGQVADIIRIKAGDLNSIAELAAASRRAALAAGRDPAHLRVLADITIAVGRDAASARERLLLLDALGEISWNDGSFLHVGDTGSLAVLLAEDGPLAGLDGWVARPASLEADTHALIDGVLPFLRGDGLVPSGYKHKTLREALNLTRTTTRVRRTTSSRVAAA